MGAGLTFDLEGPDTQSISMPSAPTLYSPVLNAEAAEVCLMALARDIPVPSWNTPGVKGVLRLVVTDDLSISLIDGAHRLVALKDPKVLEVSRVVYCGTICAQRRQNADWR